MGYYDQIIEPQNRCSVIDAIAKTKIVHKQYKNPNIIHIYLKIHEIYKSKGTEQGKTISVGKLWYSTLTNKL